MKILNLYACLGGNRYKWSDEHEITAVELDPELARLYQDRFPNDTVVVADAHQYLLDHYKEFDFVWSSPPCPTHSRIQTSLKKRDLFKPYYPDMKLYEEVLFLDQFFEGKYCVENVIPYYKPLIPGKVRDRHIYWTNFNLPTILSTRSEISKSWVGANAKDGIERIHPTQKPIYLYEWIINKYSLQGKNVLDTHLGSGSIAIACHNYGVNLVSCEIDKSYYDAAVKRLNQHQSQTKLF